MRTVLLALLVTIGLQAQSALPQWCSPQTGSGNSMTFVCQWYLVLNNPWMMLDLGPNPNNAPIGTIPPDSCDIGLHAGDNTMSINNDDGKSAIIVPINSQAIGNSKCVLMSAKLELVSGCCTYKVTYNVTFTSTWAGTTQQKYVYGQQYAGSTQNYWVSEGSWSVQGQTFGSFPAWIPGPPPPLTWDPSIPCCSDFVSQTYATPAQSGYLKVTVLDPVTFQPIPNVAVSSGYLYSKTGSGWHYPHELVQPTPPRPVPILNTAIQTTDGAGNAFFPLTMPPYAGVYWFESATSKTNIYTEIDVKTPDAISPPGTSRWPTGPQVGWAAFTTSDVGHYELKGGAPFPLGDFTSLAFQQRMTLAGTQYYIRAWPWGTMDNGAETPPSCSVQTVQTCPKRTVRILPIRACLAWGGLLDDDTITPNYWSLNIPYPEGHDDCRSMDIYNVGRIANIHPDNTITFSYNPWLATQAEAAFAQAGCQLKVAVWENGMGIGQSLATSKVWHVYGCF
jgi:hypothetical protein